MQVLVVFPYIFSDLIAVSMHMLQNHTSVSISFPGPMSPFMPGPMFSRGLIDLLVVPLHSTTILLQYLTAQVGESLIDVDAPSSRGLIVGLGTPLLSQLESSSSRDYAILLHIALVAHDHHGNVIVIFDADNLLSELRELVERIHIGDREDKQETVSLLHVELTHGRELVCASCVESGKVREDRKKTIKPYISSTTVRPSTLRVLR